MIIIDPPTVANGFVVLLVEDSPADARFVQEILAPRAYLLKHVSSLSDAHDYISQHRVKVILLDLSLPDGQGLESFLSMNAIAPDTPILVLTGLDDQEISIQAVKLGAQDYVLKKDINEQTLSRSINYAIERKRSEEAVRQSAMQAKEAQSALKLALSASRIGVWSYNLATRMITTDEQIAAIFGIEAGTFGDRFEDYLDRVVGDDRETVLQSINTAIAARSDHEVEHAIVWPDGDIHYVNTRGKVLCDDDGRPVRMTGICVDITERKVAEMARLQLATIVESSDDGIISKTLDGVVLSWNQAAERIYGYSAEEMVGESVARLVPQDMTDEFAAITDRLRHGERIEQLETIRQCKNGTIIDVSLTISPMKDSTGTVFGASTIVRDITKRKRTERFLSVQYAVARVLSEAESLADAAPKVLQSIVETLYWETGEIWSVDKDQQVLKCVDLFHSDEVVDWEEFEALSRHVTFAINVGLPGQVWSLAEPVWIDDIRANKNFPRVHVANKIGLRTGVGFPILRGNQVLGVITFFSRRHRGRDQEMIGMLSSIGEQVGQFMDRKTAEQVAQQATLAEQRIARAILENSPIGIAFLNRNLEVTEANRVFGKQFGIDVKDLIGTFIFEIPAGIPNDKIIEVVQSGVPFSVSEFRVTISDEGTLKDSYCDLTVWPVKAGADDTVGLIILTIDVTERVKLTKQREDFVATLTHDLKNPLIGQERLLDLILGQHVGPMVGEQADILSVLKAGTTEMLELIGTLLEVYRYEDGSPQLRLEQVDLLELITGCIAQASPLAEANNTKIKSNLPASLPRLLADQVALRRVVKNLLDNAIKFTPAAGSIVVSCLPAGNNLTITVEDSGAGIPAEELPKLFQRFAQGSSGRRQSAGTGLGLFLCRQIVEAHGGNITCSSQEGHGSKFLFTIPLESGGEDE
jgi:PAS domain S-box-containing protein